MRIVWTLFSFILCFSLALNAVQYNRMDTLNDTISRLEREKNVLETARKADAAAIEALKTAQTEAMRNAQMQRETLQSVENLDDAAFCERIGGVWVKRRAAHLPATAGGAAR